MQMLTISCPSCNFSRQMPADKVPEGERRVTCPQCKQVFTYAKPFAPESPQNVPFTQQQAAAETVQAELSPPSAALQPMAGEAAPRPRRPRPAPPRELMDIGTLFNRSWKLFQQRFATLIGLYLLTILAFILPLTVTAGLAVLIGGAQKTLLLVVALLIGGCAAMYLGFRCFSAFLSAVVEEGMGLAEAYGKGGAVTFPLMWVGFLTGFIISGGFLLLVIPGIAFFIWFSFSQFIMIRENVRGMGALLKSREYVRGRWFDVSLRLLLVWAASVVIGMIPLAGPLLGIAFFPYVMIFHYLLYRDLQEVKGDVPYSCGTLDLLTWPAVALVGYIAIPALLLTLVGGQIMAKLRHLPLQGMTIVTTENISPSGSKESSGYRVINFPAQGAPANPSTTQAEAPNSSSQPVTPETAEKRPENIHFFIYAVNYSGTVKVNGVSIKNLEGKTDMQYNYNIGDTGLKYGENRIELDYSEVPSHQQSLREVHISVSRNNPGTAREMLGEWRVNDNGSGSKSFTLDIPK